MMQVRAARRRTIQKIPITRKIHLQRKRRCSRGIQRIRDWNFVKFEIEAGPPHPDSFVDELLVNLYDKSTGQGWNKSYLVATPAGLEEILRKRKSNFIFLPQTLVMNRYDVNQLRKAVLGDLGAMEEERGDVPRDGTDATAPGHQTDL
jgi:hypothetical protein